ncbi:MAG: exo-alpha-sialidase [Pirellulales bacterium]|nr:exo-alpha-sialidase [Pirellulales bacterium]
MTLRRSLPGFALLALSALNALALDKVEVFQSGQDGYHTYRIPAIIQTNGGTMLAFCEGRKSSNSDIGDIDLLVKRSKDGGRTWSRPQVIWSDAANTCGNPCPVVDRRTGQILLLATHNLEKDHLDEIMTKKSPGTRTVWVLSSADDGETWSPPREITRAVKDPSWGWYATGPGIGIQIRHGPHAGRLVVPANHSYDDPQGGLRGKPYESGAHVFYSDDGGRSWKLGGTIRPKMNEAQVAELPDGRGTLLMNMRSLFRRGVRGEATSTDGGLTWSAPRDVPALVEPNCQGSLLTHEAAGGRGVVLFSNPADHRPKQRRNMTVRLSEDNARTWPRALTLHPGLSAYSCLVSIDAGSAGCLYENGENDRYERLTFARFTLEEIKPLP